MDKKTVAISGVWLRNIGDETQVLVEVDGQWKQVIVELSDGSFSHIVETSGIDKAPLDPLTWDEIKG